MSINFDVDPNMTLQLGRLDRNPASGRWEIEGGWWIWDGMVVSGWLLLQYSLVNGRMMDIWVE